jgi:LmbE family N-acetylglucosaminyl deacetylase
MRRWADWRYPVTVLSVTDGEAAHPDWPGLKNCRRAELDRALSVLSRTGIRAVRLALPDGGVEDNRAALEEALVTLSENRPTLIAPYECDGHPDHDATGRACLQIARVLELPIARYPIWAWHHREPHHFQGTPFGRFALEKPTQASKAAAINCFTSQLAPGEVRLPIVPVHVLDYFRRDFEAFLL